MIGIPIIKRKNDILNEVVEWDYRNLKYTELFISSHGKTLIFKGYLDGDVTLKKMIKYLNEGIYKTVTSGR